MVKGNELPGEGDIQKYYERNVMLGEWQGKMSGQHSWSDQFKGNFYVRGNMYRFTLMVRGFLVLWLFIMSFLIGNPNIELSKETRYSLEFMAFYLDCFIWLEYFTGAICMSVVQTFLKVTKLSKLADRTMMAFYLYSNPDAPASLGDAPYYAFDLKVQNYMFCGLKISALVYKLYFPWYLSLPFQQGVLWFCICHHTSQIPLMCAG